MEKNRESLILEYAGLAADSQMDEDPDKLKSIESRKREIEDALRMSLEEIILEAKRLLL